MPIHTVKLKDGSTGYRYGNSGKVYKDRAGAVRQAQAIHATGWTEEKRKTHKDSCPKCGKEPCECKTASFHRFNNVVAACLNKAASLNK